MLLPGSPDEELALKNALGDPIRRMRMKLEIDWNRTNLYDHAYSDLSRYLTSVTTDRGTETLLPPEVNALAGFSSGELKATLEGSIPDGTKRGRSICSLFDPYDNTSPTPANDLFVLPIRYSRVTRTVLGDVERIVFTGFIRAFPFSRTARKVEITATDILNFADQPVTLPHWAVRTVAPYFSWTNGLAGSSLAISNVWVAEEILRQSGRPVSPLPRPDGVLFQSCSGSLLPSLYYGDASNSYQIPLDYHVLPNVADPWEVSQFSFKPAQTYHRSVLTTNRQVVVPTNGSGLPQVNIGCSEFVTTAGTGTRLTQSTYYIGDYQIGGEPFVTPGTFEDPYGIAEYCYLQVREDGRIVVGVNKAGDNPGGANVRQWSWSNTATRTGEHHYNVVFRFASSGITVEVRVDGTVLTMTPNGGNSAGGFIYRVRPAGEAYNGGPLLAGRRNVAMIESELSQFAVQWYAGDSTRGYLATDAIAPVRPDNGKPWADVNELTGGVAFMPDVTGSKLWDVLRQVIGSEYGILWMDEYGTCRVLARQQVEDISDESNLTNAMQLSDRQLDELLVTPSADSKRNVVRITRHFRGQIEDFIWKQQAAKDRYLPILGAVNGALEPLTDVIAVNTRMVQSPSDPPATGDVIDVRSGRVSAVFADLPTNESNFFQAAVLGDPNQRQMSMSWANNETDEIFVGTYKGAQQPNWSIAGRRYSDEVTATVEVIDAADVAVFGPRVLEIDSQWQQQPDAVAFIANSLLSDTVNPVPILNSVRVPADPRRQVFDIVKINNETGTSGTMFGQIMNKATEDSLNGFHDVLTMRVIVTPTDWFLGVPGASELGVSTTL
jgi:hypothetical protein